MNGQPWTRSEIDELCDIVAQGGDTLWLSRKLDRTHEAVIAKAKRLNLDRIPRLATSGYRPLPASSQETQGSFLP